MQLGFNLSNRVTDTVQLDCNLFRDMQKYLCTEVC